MQKINFSKYQGAGNDFIVVDNRGDDYRMDEATRHQMCDRHFGIGADGMVEIKPSCVGDFRVVYFNSNGKEGSLCGNGCRCAMAFARRLGIKAPSESTVRPSSSSEPMIVRIEYSFETSDGLHTGILTETLSTNGVVKDYFVKFRNFVSAEIKSFNEEEYYLDTGSPHHVKFVKAVEDVDVFKEGRELRYNMYGERGSNVNFASEFQQDTCEFPSPGLKGREDGVQLKDHKNLWVRTYERGVENETLACGTGAVAVSVIHFAKQLMAADKTKTEMAASEMAVSRRVLMNGGELAVCFNVVKEKDRFLFKDVYLSGPAEHVFDGVKTVIT